MFEKFLNGMFGLMAPDDGVPDMSGFDEDEQDLPEIITLQPGEEIPSDEVPDDKVTLSRAEFDELKQGTNSTSALLEGFKGLQETLKPKEAVNMQQAPGESDAEFEKRLEKELFSEGKSGAAIKEAIQRYGGGQMAQLMGMLSEQNKELIKLHPEKSKVYGRYEGEIEKFVKELPPDQQRHPQVWDYALQQVKARHAEDIQQDTIEELVAKRVAEELAKQGIGGERKANGRPKQEGYMESGRSGANAGSSSRKQRVFVTADDKRNAEISGVPIEHYLRKIGKLR